MRSLAILGHTITRRNNISGRNIVMYMPIILGVSDMAKFTEAISMASVLLILIKFSKVCQI